MKTYNVQTRVRISGVFTDTTGAKVDPTDVRLVITSPSRVSQEVTPVREDVGTYHFDVTIDQSGIWLYKWQGTGSLIAASPVNLMRAF